MPDKPFNRWGSMNVQNQTSYQGQQVPSQNPVYLPTQFQKSSTSPALNIAGYVVDGGIQAYPPKLIWGTILLGLPALYAIASIILIASLNEIGVGLGILGSLPMLVSVIVGAVLTHKSMQQFELGYVKGRGLRTTNLIIAYVVLIPGYILSTLFFGLVILASFFF